MNARKSQQDKTVKNVEQTINELGEFFNKNITRSLRQPCNGVTLSHENGKVTIIIYPENNKEQITSNTFVWVKNTAEKFLKKRGLNKIQIEITGPTTKNQDSFTQTMMYNEVSDSSIAIFASNLARLTNAPQLIQIINTKTEKEKIEYLRSYLLNNILFDEKINNFFSLNNNPAVNKIDFLLGLSSYFNKDLGQLRLLMNNNIDTLTKRIKQHIEIDENKSAGENQDEIHIRINWNMLRQKIYNYPISPKGKWNIYKFLYTLIEDSIEDHKIVIIKYKLWQETLIALQNMIVRLNIAFSKLTRAEACLLMGGDYLDGAISKIYDELPWMRQILQEEMQIIAINITTYINGNTLLEPYLTFSENLIKSSIFVIPSNNVAISTVNTTNKATTTTRGAPASLPMPVFDHATLAQAISSSASTTDNKRSESASSEQKFTLFSSDTPDSSSYTPSSNSVTAEYKSLAKEKIEKGERRTQAHLNRSPEIIDALTSAVTTPAPSAPDENMLTLSINQNNQLTTVAAFQLKGVKHLYLTCDITIPPEDKYQIFKNVALQAKILKHDSLGQNGIKLYGLDCLIVKCKQFREEHLLFVAHQIHGTENYVYIPFSLVSHDKYEKLLNNKHDLDILAKKARDAISVYVVHTSTNANSRLPTNENEKTFEKKFT